MPQLCIIVKQPLITFVSLLSKWKLLRTSWGDTDDTESRSTLQYKIGLHSVWLLLLEMTIKAKKYTPKKVILLENIWGPHFRRLTSLAHFRSIYIIAVVPANIGHDLDLYNGNTK